MVELADNRASENRPVVAGGCFRSGTTLVRRILNAHPRLMNCLGERFDPAQTRCNAAATAGGVEDWKIDATGAVHAASVGRWRRDLAPAVAERVWTACGDLWREIDPHLRWLAGPPPARTGGNP